MVITYWNEENMVIINPTIPFNTVLVDLQPFRIQISAILSIISRFTPENTGNDPCGAGIYQLSSKNDWVLQWIIGTSNWTHLKGP